MKHSRLEKRSPARIQALFGLFPRALSELLAATLPALLEQRRQAQERQPDRKRAVGGGRKRRLLPYQEVLLTLLYLRHNVSHEVVGSMFGVSADTSENTFHEVVVILQQVCPSGRWDAEKKWNKRTPNWQPRDQDRLLIDSFETPIRRPSDDTRQRRTYSGKKKRHTLKSQVVTDAKGEILELDTGHRGPKADIRIYEESGVEERYPKAHKTADKAYQSSDHPTLHTPQKKPKGGELTPEQREENRRLSQKRIFVEHSVRRIKGWRILREDYRLAVGLFATVAHTVVGLVQLGRIIG
jgi:hypothetical protein